MGTEVGVGTTVAGIGMSGGSSSSFRACLLSITHVYACAVSTVLMRPWVSCLKTKLWIVTGWWACCPKSLTVDQNLSGTG